MVHVSHLFAVSWKAFGDLFHCGEAAGYEQSRLKLSRNWYTFEGERSFSGVMCILVLAPAALFILADYSILSSCV
jgi:hypothetical protein